MEFWESIPGDDTLYCVSTFGRIWSSNHGIIKTPPNNFGYPHFNRMIDGKRKRTLVHRVLAAAFLPNPEDKKTVNHKNGVRDDNRIENLEWATSAEQNRHSVDVLGRKGPENNHRKKSVLAINDKQEVVLAAGIREMGRKLSIPYQAVQTGIKFSDRRYFGWRFKIIHDPKWTPAK